MPDKAAQMTTDFDAARRLARTQNHGDGTAALRIVDMDRQEAARVVVGVEQRELLASMDDVAGVVDVQDNSLRWVILGVHPLIDERVRETDGVFQGRRVLQPGHGWLRAKIVAAIGQSAAGELEGGIHAQEVEVVSVLVAAGDRQNPRADHVSQRMGDAQRVAMIGEATRKTVGKANTPIGHRKQHHAAVGADASTIEGG